MRIQFHTPAGTVVLDSETAADGELEAIGLDRQGLNAAVTRDLSAELDAVKARVAALEGAR